MSNINRKLIVFDYETSHIDPKSDLCDPVELAAVVIDIKKREIIPNSEFSATICPPDINKEDYYDNHKMTIKFHCDKLGMTSNEIINRWRAGTPEKIAWKEFQNYIRTYGGGKGFNNMPIQGGQNIRSFDMEINKRMHARYKTTDLFWKRDVIDIMDIFNYWYMYSNDKPENFKLDTFREYYKLDSGGAHTAIFDTIQSAKIICVFLNIFENICNKVDLHEKISSEFGLNY